MYLPNLLDSIPVAIYTVDAEGFITSFNRAAVEFAGREPQLGHDKWCVTRRLFYKDGRPMPPDECPMAQALHEDRAISGAEAVMERSDGTRVPFIPHPMPLHDPSGRLIGGVNVLVDITERKRSDLAGIAIENDRAKQALINANRRQKEFLATLAHELRNPLAPIRNGLSVLQAQRPDREAFDATAALIHGQIDQMVRLIDDLLDMSRITSNKLVLHKEHLDLANLVRQAAEVALPSLERAQRSLALNLPDGPIMVHGDPVRLMQVVGNLLNNAAKFTDPGGQITVTVDSDGQTASLEVRDDGRGIPGDILADVFTMFTQAHPADGGLGIGLTLVQQFVDMHGGRVAAASDGVGRGSTFTVSLPLARSLPPAPPRTPASPERRSGAALGVPCAEPAAVDDQGLAEGDAAAAALGARAASPGRRLMVVDDNHAVARILSMLLTVLGHEVRTVFSGEEALAVATKWQPEAIFLDLGMPHLDGNTVARRLRAQPWAAQVRLVALSGWGQESDRRQSRAAGFDRHLVKPVSRDTLTEVLDSLFEEDDQNTGT